jgi:hypothetical protein
MDSYELCTGQSPDPEKDEILNGKNKKGDKKLLDDLMGFGKSDDEIRAKAAAEADSVIRHGIDGSVKIGGKADKDTAVSVYMISCSDPKEFLDKCQDESARLRKQIRDAIARIYKIEQSDEAMQLYMSMVQKYAAATGDENNHAMDVVAIMAVAAACHDLYVEMVANEQGE